MKAILRRLSTVMFSPSQNCDIAAVSGSRAARSATGTCETNFGWAGSFSDQTLRPAVPLATMKS